MHLPRSEPGRSQPDLSDHELDMEASCPGCGEWRLIEYDAAIRRWVCARSAIGNGGYAGRFPRTPRVAAGWRG